MHNFLSKTGAQNNNGQKCSQNYTGNVSGGGVGGQEGTRMRWSELVNCDEKFIP
jgi:hypothetical protein